MIGYGALGGQADQLKGSTSASTVQQKKNIWHNKKSLMIIKK
jgi:hypothetical protein